MEKQKKTLHEHFIMIQNLFFIGLGIMVFGAVIDTGIWTWILMAVGLLVAVAGCVYHYKYWKCPHCGNRLNVRGVPKYCPDCGKELE